MVSSKVNKQGNLCNEGMLSHIMWWKEVLANIWLLWFWGVFHFHVSTLMPLFCHSRFLIYCFQRMESCRKPSSVQLTQRLVYSNILGLDPTLRNGRWIRCLTHPEHNYAMVISHMVKQIVIVFLNTPCFKWLTWYLYCVPTPVWIAPSFWFSYLYYSLHVFIFTLLS